MSTSNSNGMLPMGIQMVGMSAMPMMGMAMGGVPMMAPGGVAMQPMPMQPMSMMAPMVSCRVVCEMSADGMTMKLKAVDAEAMGLLKERCDAMNALTAMSAPTTITCGPMPLLVCTPQGAGR